MADITYFFSYAREDSETVLKLAKELRHVGASLWVDQLDILGGQRWDRAVEEALQSCQGMLAVLSPESVQSTNVMDEVSYALEQGKLVVPILLRSCTIPFRLRRVQYIDFTVSHAAGLDQLLKALGIDSTRQGQAPSRHLSTNARGTALAEPQTPLDHAAHARKPVVPGAPGRSTPDDQMSVASNTSSGSPSAASPVTVPGIRRSENWAPTAWRSTVLLWSADFFYTLFTLFLLNSTGDDRAGGYMFLVNGIILTAGCIAASVKLVRPEHVGITAGVLQMGIMVVMLFQRIGDASVVLPLNLGIALVFAACGFAHRMTKIKAAIAARGQGVDISRG